MTDTPNASEADHDITAGSAEWLWYATGSKVPAMMGVSKFTTRLGLWRQMTGKEPPEPTNAYMQHGIDREPIIREGTAAGLGVTMHTSRMLVSKANPRHAYSPDAILDDSARFGPIELWECKAPQDIERWGPEGTDKIDPQYYPQVQWGLYVTGLRACTVTLEPHRDFMPLYTADYHVDRDDDYIAELVAVVDEFLGYVDADTPPPPLGAVVITDPALIELVQRWAKDNAQKLDFEKAIKEARKTIDPLGENARALMTEDGEVLCHWTGGEDKTVETVDWAAIEAAHPGAAKAATRTYVDHTALAYLVPEAVKAHTTTTTTSTTPSLKMGARK